ncbi:MAG: Flp pilus assembly complex ATPase component TadA [Elusimicrobia bacterium]|nr:Flp pilus assembly complex ATPase component TadA [Elusimicrobiota bacterium]
MAVEAALTGHLVLSTAHSTDAAHTIARLITLGVNAHLAASALSGIVSARLIRRLCERCRRPYEAGADVVKQLGTPVTGHLYEVVGCDHCRQTGYLGRIGIFELATLDPSLQEIIQSDASVPQIQTALSKMDIQTLWKDGLSKVLAGETTVDELMRVTRDG